MPQSTTSLNIAFPDVPRGESSKLLDAKTTFQVKDAAFLSILDALLSSTNTKCNVECRGLKAVKLTLDIQDKPAGPILDGLARAGSARLWVFPNKLLLCPQSLLTKEEKQSAKLYGVFLTLATLPADKDKSKYKNILDIANTKTSVQWNNVKWGDAADRVDIPGPFPDFGISIGPGGPLASIPTDRWIFTGSMPDTTMGEALSFLAHGMGAELYIVPDRFIIAPPDGIPEQYKSEAVPAFTPQSTHFGSNSPFDPSAKGS